jgi:hypothetical protein
MKMERGAIITSGAKPWQIIQQGMDGTAEIRLAGRFGSVRLPESPPFRFIEDTCEGAKVFARIVLEDSGEAAADWQLCDILPERGWETVFPRIPAGGLYRIETRMEYSGWNGYSVTRGDMVHHIGVGDIFAVCGQSNACGRAKTPIMDPPDLGVHVLRPSGQWDLATHPLGETTGAVHTGHFENHNPGHSPFLHMGKRLKKALGHPIGIVMLAHGGTPLSWWNPDENGTLADNMIQILLDEGISPRAAIWYQGEAECYENGAETYAERFESFAMHVRKGLRMPELPFVAVQLNRCLNGDDIGLDRSWGLVRQAQAALAHYMKGVCVVPANDLPMFDFAHLAPEGNLRLGERLADALLGSVHGRGEHWRAPEARSAERVSPAKIRLSFRNVMVKLDVFSLPPSTLPIECEDADGFAPLVAYEIEHDSLLLEFARPIGEGAVLHGAWRMHPGIAIPQDLGRSPMLSFYGLPVNG